jgi:hypothetical protein
MSHDTEATSSKRKYDSAIDTSCAFETNDITLTTANFVLRCYSDVAKSESMTGISQH